MITRRPRAFHVHSALGSLTPTLTPTLTLTLALTPNLNLAVQATAPLAERPRWRRLGVACGNVRAEFTERSIQPRSLPPAGGTTKSTRLGAGGHSCPPIRNLSARSEAMLPPRSAREAMPPSCASCTRLWRPTFIVQNLFLLHSSEQLATDYWQFVTSCPLTAHRQPFNGKGLRSTGRPRSVELFPTRSPNPLLSKS